jgi:hypothetical protein
MQVRAACPIGKQMPMIVHHIELSNILQLEYIFGVQKRTGVVFPEWLKLLRATATVRLEVEDFQETFPPFDATPHWRIAISGVVQRPVTPTTQPR